MQNTIVDLHISLPLEDLAAAQSILKTIRDAGFFGFQTIDPSAGESLDFGLLARVDYADEDATLDFPLLVVDEGLASTQPAGAQSPVAHVRDLDERLTALAKRIGYPCYFYEPHTDWELIVDSEDEETDSAADELSQQAAAEDTVHEGADQVALAADRSAFIIYGKVVSPDRFVYELARDIKGPVILVPGAPTIGFAVDSQEGTAVWLGKRPVLEITQSELTFVQWHSASTPKTGSISSRIQDRFLARHSWVLSAEPYIAVTHAPLQDREEVMSSRQDTANLHELFDAQDAALQTAFTESALDRTEDVAAAHQLAEEIGLHGDKRAGLVHALTSIDRRVSLAELITALGLPTSTEEVLLGARDPRTLDGATTAEKANFRSETGFKNLTERPTGNSFTDRMRQLDHDRPALALVIIFLMFAASAGLLYLGIARTFSGLALTISAYVLATITLADSVTSLVSWIMIRMKNRAGQQKL